MFAPNLTSGFLYAISLLSKEGNGESGAPSDGNALSPRVEQKYAHFGIHQGRSLSRCVFSVVMAMVMMRTEYHVRIGY